MSDFLDYEGLKVLKNKNDEAYLQEEDIIDIAKLPKSQNVNDNDLLIKGLSATGELYTVTVEDFIESEKSELLKDARYITNTAISYQISSSGSSAPTGTWSSSPVATSDGQYLWTRIVFTYVDGQTDTFYAIGKAGETGAKGDTGDPGENGKMLYGTCSTATGTAAKVVACTDATSLYTGLSILVKFTVANTANAPTVNVNSLGAKNIYVNGATASSSNPFRWAANTYIHLVYDGTYFIPVDIPGSFYGAGSVAASTAAKTSTINEFVLRVGTEVTLQSSTANTNSAPTLNVSATGAYSIYTNNVAGCLWGANQAVTFVFDGSYWRAVQKASVSGSTLTLI